MSVSNPHPKSLLAYLPLFLQSTTFILGLLKRFLFYLLFTYPSLLFIKALNDHIILLLLLYDLLYSGRLSVLPYPLSFIDPSGMKPPLKPFTLTAFLLSSSTLNSLLFSRWSLPLHVTPLYIWYLFLSTFSTCQMCFPFTKLPPSLHPDPLHSLSRK